MVVIPALAFTVPGPPVGQPTAHTSWRHRDGRAREKPVTYYPGKRIGPWRNAVALHALAARQKLRVAWPLDREYRLTFWNYQTGEKPDRTNIKKGLEDALTSILWNDDRQVVADGEGQRYLVGHGGGWRMAQRVEVRVEVIEAARVTNRAGRRK